MSAPDQIAFDVQGCSGADQNASELGSPSGSNPTEHRYALPDEM
jgi:hypothetical protein